MKTTIEKESPTKLKLLIEVEPEELLPLYEQTYKRLATEVNVPGFRKGKVPRAVLESRLGKDTLRSEFLRDALPSLYSRAAQKEEVRAIALPDIEVTSFDEDTVLSFTATVEVRPEISLPDYRGIEVEKADASPTDEQLSEQVERLRDRFGTLEAVARNATKGDYVTIDLTGYRHDQKIDEASATDLLYEVGSGTFVPELDTELEGKRAGDILKFNAKLPPQLSELAGEEVSFSVLVKEVQAKRLPTLDDEFAKTASEFETFAELQQDLRKRLEAANEIEAEIDYRNRILDDLIDRTDVPVPESMVAAEVQHRLTHFIQDLQKAGITPEQYLEANQSSEEQLVDAFKKAAERTIAADLVLDAVAKAEEIKVGGEEVDQEIERMAEQIGREPAEVRRQLVEADRVLQLAGDILRRKTLSFLADKATKIGVGSSDQASEELKASDEKE